MHELPMKHGIELRLKRETLHQLKKLKENPAWTYLCQHIDKVNTQRKESLLQPAYTQELQQKQNYDKGIIMGTQMFTAGIDISISDLDNDIALLEKKVEDEHETD